MLEKILYFFFAGFTYFAYNTEQIATMTIQNIASVTNICIYPPAPGVLSSILPKIVFKNMSGRYPIIEAIPMAVPATFTGMFNSCIVENITPYRHIENSPGINVSIAITIVGNPNVPPTITRMIDIARIAPPHRNHPSVDLNTLSAKIPPSGAATNITMYCLKIENTPAVVVENERISVK